MKNYTKKLLFFFLFCTQLTLHTAAFGFHNTSSTYKTIKFCPKPSLAVTNLQLQANGTQVVGWFTPTNSTDNYLVLYSTAPLLTVLPKDGATYTTGGIIGNATVAGTGTTTSFLINGLAASKIYYIYVFTYVTNCTTGIVGYLTTKYTSGNVTTSATNLLNSYYGNLHAHTSYSDGGKDSSTLTPANAYEYAKNSLCMDFLGISEHNHATAGMHLVDWQPGLNQAVAASTSKFLALYGMEWGVISDGGHVLVYGTDKLIGWENNNNQLFVAKSDYTGNNGLFKTINALGSPALAILAHPGSSDFNYLSENAYNPSADSAIVGSALESGPAFSTVTNYTAPDNNLEYYSYYLKMLAKGYHLGPNIDHDNHYTTFGRTSYSRLAVLSPTLSRNDFFAALKKRQFFATQDCDTRAAFWLNNQPMGSITEGNTPPAIAIYAADPTNSTIKPFIKLMYGVAGSNITPTTLFTATGNQLTYTHTAALNDVEGYYFADITINGNRTITSPVWYTKRSGALPLQWLYVQGTINTEQQAVINWQVNGHNEQVWFVLEKSRDGLRFATADSVFNGTQTQFSWTDKQSIGGTTYYRIKQINQVGAISYSTVVPVTLAALPTFRLQVAPNPLQQQQLQLITESAQLTPASLQLYNPMGQLVWQLSTALAQGKATHRYTLPSTLVAGVYTLRAATANSSLTYRVVIGGK